MFSSDWHGLWYSLGFSATSDNPSPVLISFVGFQIIRVSAHSTGCSWHRPCPMVRPAWWGRWYADAPVSEQHCFTSSTGSRVWVPRGTGKISRWVNKVTKTASVSGTARPRLPLAGFVPQWGYRSLEQGSLIFLRPTTGTRTLPVYFSLQDNGTRGVSRGYCLTSSQGKSWGFISFLLSEGTLGPDPPLTAHAFSPCRSFQIIPTYSALPHLPEDSFGVFAIII